MMNNGGNQPCPCNVCREISYDKEKKELQYNKRKVTQNEWNGYRREHNMFAMNNLMKMIYTAIDEKHVELIREKLVNSELRNLKALIPQFYQ